ncbi:hypothetical protein [Thiohalocapsa sp.]|jgi:putative transposase|uniref:hypothetical protein n=1 Tax=Thiohalocapsa sp. TaxID=2497641 RepID=UPI0025D6AE40|nr:hypothetical protein [Thiohalocapsa sp.]
MVADPAHYRWSSYRANVLGEPDALLTPHPLYLALGADAAARLGAYRELFPRRARRQIRQRPAAGPEP